MSARAINLVPLHADRESDDESDRESDPAKEAREVAIKADGQSRRVRVEAEQELVLECGRASITLHASGRIVIKGVHVETTASSLNRIKGAQVRIN